MSARKKIPDKYKNGWLDELDTRTATAKTIVERYKELTNDIGGLPALTYQQRSLAERALWLEYWLAVQERTLANGGEFNINGYTAGLNTLQGVFAKLGLNRKTKEKSLSQIMSQ